MNVRNVDITKPTGRQNRQIESLLRDYRVLINTDGIATIQRRVVTKEFERKFAEIFCEG